MVGWIRSVTSADSATVASVGRQLCHRDCMCESPSVASL